MHSLLRVLVLMLLLLSPCVAGCSSQMSPEEAERLEAESGDEDADADEGVEFDEEDEI